MSVNGTGANEHAMTIIILIPVLEKYSLIPPRKSWTPNVMIE